MHLQWEYSFNTICKKPTGELQRALSVPHAAKLWQSAYFKKYSSDFTTPPVGFSPLEHISKKCLLNPRTQRQEGTKAAGSCTCFFPCCHLIESAASSLLVSPSTQNFNLLHGFLYWAPRKISISAEQLLINYSQESVLFIFKALLNLLAWVSPSPKIYSIHSFSSIQFPASFTTI